MKERHQSTKLTLQIENTPWALVLAKSSVVEVPLAFCLQYMSLGSVRKSPPIWGKPWCRKRPDLRLRKGEVGLVDLPVDLRNRSVESSTQTGFRTTPSIVSSIQRAAHHPSRGQASRSSEVKSWAKEWLGLSIPMGRRFLRMQITRTVSCDDHSSCNTRGNIECRNRSNH